MTSCMGKHATQDMQDQAREEWFATADLRRREREETERRKVEAQAFNAEWWKRDD